MDTGLITVLAKQYNIANIDTDTSCWKYWRYRYFRKNYRRYFYC